MQPVVPLRHKKKHELVLSHNERIMGKRVICKCVACSFMLLRSSDSLSAACRSTSCTVRSTALCRFPKSVAAGTREPPPARRDARSDGCCHPAMISEGAPQRQERMPHVLQRSDFDEVQVFSDLQSKSKLDWSPLPPTTYFAEPQ